MVWKSTPTLLAVAIALSACATGALPTGPRFVALPSYGKTARALQDDDLACRFNSMDLSTGWDSSRMQAQYDAAYAHCLYLRGDAVRPSNGLVPVPYQGTYPFPYPYGLYATGYGFGPSRFVPLSGYPYPLY